MSDESSFSHMIDEPFVILSSDIIFPFSNHNTHYFCFTTCILLRNFSRYLFGVSLFWNRLAVSRFAFHVVMYMLFPLSTLNAIYFIIFRISTELIFPSIFFQSSFPFIFARRLSVHFPRTSKYNFLALPVSTRLYFVYALTSYLYMYLSISYVIECKASGFSNVGIFNSFIIIFISSPLSYFLATYPLMRRMEFLYMSAL